MAAASAVRPAIAVPKKSRALTALNSVASEKMTETSPEGMKAVAA